MQRLAQFVFSIVMLFAGAVGLAMTACGGYFFLSSITDAFQLSLFALVSIGLGAMLMSAAWKCISKVMSDGNDE
jgi:divalent metal cation (Fe/Co/Zn/Cd) transporter